MLDFVDSAIDAISGALGGLSDSIIGGFLSALDAFIGKVAYYFTIAVMYLVSIMQSLFNVFAGITKVQSDGTKQYLINVFFSNNAINNVYWAMALLGITFVVAFTIIAVIRKTFDLNDKRQNQSMGGILGGMFKSILIMLLLASIMSAAITLSNTVIDRVSYIFDNADSFDKETEIEFTDEQFATMARIYKTIGNYSMNPSYGTRYNLNSCYNELRPDLQYLQNQGVFDLVYITKDPTTGKTVDTWQSVLQELAYASDVNHELNINVYHEGVSDVLLRIMNLLKTNRDFFPLERYGRNFSTGNSVGLDRILFLTGTTSAARNQSYNVNPYVTDGLRGAFYSGEKSIYSFSEVDGAFDTGITGINYVLIVVLAYFTLRNLLRCIFGCISRIFNMVSLYVIAPLTIATMPLDDGEKFKQWTTSMIIQGLVIFGNIIPMRLVIIFAPIILGPDLVLFESTTLNFIGKALLIVGGLQAVEGFSQIVIGILANSAGTAAVREGDKMSGFSDSIFNTGVKGAKATGKFAAKAGAMVAGGAAVGGLAAAGIAAGVGLATAGLAVGGVGAGLYHGARGLGHVGSKIGKYFSDKSANSKLASAAKEANQKNSEPQYASTGSGQSPQGGGSGAGQMIEMADLSGSNSHTGNDYRPPDSIGTHGTTPEEGYKQMRDEEREKRSAQTSGQTQPPEADFEREAREKRERDVENAYREAKSEGRTIPKDSPYYSEKYDVPLAQLFADEQQPSSSTSKDAHSEEPWSSPRGDAGIAAGTSDTGNSGNSGTQPSSSGNLPGTRVKQGTDPLTMMAKPSKNKTPPPQNYSAKK